MVGCSAPNCANKTEKGFRLFRFPTDDRRNAIWLQNCRRDKWKPTSNSRLCEEHFEESQWEPHRADGWRKLKPNAVPTLFNVPNPPKKLISTRRSVYKDTTPSERAGGSGTAYPAVENDTALSDEIFAAEEQEQIRNLKSEVVSLNQELEKKEFMMQTFLNGEQISALEQTPNKWSAESILLGLKLRFSLGLNGYNFLRSTKYPLPSIATLNRRIQNFKPNFGIFMDLHEPLTCKVGTMDDLDRMCTLSIDEMEISGKMDFDKNQGQFFGRTTLGDPKAIGNHLTVVLARGVKTSWKQIIACEVTGATTKGDLQAQLIDKCVHFVQSCGLTVVAVTSDMGSNNRSMWRAFGVHVNREHRITTSKMGGSEVEMIPDVCHLLKNLKNALLNNGLFLPKELVEKEELPNNFVTGSYIVELWKKEINNRKEIRLLHHLQRTDVEPTHFSKMNVGSAMRIFSIKTGAALEVAVKLKILPVEALTTAFFCRLISKWFSIVSAKISKASITCRNKKSKFDILNKVIDIFQEVMIGGGWKPLNTGVIMASLSLMKISEKLLAEGYKFVLLHRFTQDALENIFSQIRRKSGSCPSALQCLNALKLITVSHFVSDVNRSSYCSDRDTFLIDTVINHKKLDSTPASPAFSEEVLQITSPSDSNLDEHDLNILFNIGGSTTKAMLKATCETCATFLNLGDYENQWGTLVEYSSLGNLKKPNSELFKLIVNCEVLFRRYEELIEQDGVHRLIEKIVEEIDVSIPNCCNLKKKIAKHFFTVRCYAFVNFDRNTKRKTEMFGTSSKKIKLG